MRKADVALAVCSEKAAKANVDAGKDCVENIAAHIAGTGGDYCSVLGKKANKRWRHQPHQHRDQAAVHHRDCHGVLEHLTRAVALARAGILRRECADGGAHGTRHNEQKADHLFDQAHGGSVDEPSVVGNDGDEHKRHLDAAVLHGHGHADLKNAAEHLGLGAQVATLNVDVRAAALEPHKREGNAGRLGGHRAERRAHGAEPHMADKQKIERDVDDACHANHVHRRARIAQPAKDGRKNIVRGDKRNADKANAQVGGSAFDCLGRRANERHDLRAQRKQDGGQYHRDAHKQRDGVADGCLGAVKPTRAHSVADDNRRSHGQAHERHSDDIERLRAIAHGGDAGGTAELPHHVQVGHAVEHLQKVREHIGQGKDRDGLKDIAACEVVFHGRGFLAGFLYVPV